MCLTYEIARHYNASRSSLFSSESPNGELVTHDYRCERNESSVAVRFSSDIFTALHGMQTRSSDENSVSPSVRPSVCQTRGLWQNGRKICPDFYTVRKII